MKVSYDALSRKLTINILYYSPRYQVFFKKSLFKLIHFQNIDFVVSKFIFNYQFNFND